jgi:hypothetical protein
MTKLGTSPLRNAKAWARFLKPCCIATPCAIAPALSVAYKALAIATTGRVASGTGLYVEAFLDRFAQCPCSFNEPRSALYSQGGLKADRRNMG